jgi:hypothetical protein
MCIIPEESRSNTGMVPRVKIPISNNMDRNPYYWIKKINLFYDTYYNLFNFSYLKISKIWNKYCF